MIGRPRGSVAFRLALNYGALIVLTLAIVLAVVYHETVGVLERRIDQHIEASAERMVAVDLLSDADDLASVIQRVLRDDEDADTEVYLLYDPRGRRTIGNIEPLPAEVYQRPTAEVPVVRNGRRTQARLRIRPLRDGSFLVVGSDLHHQQEVERLFWRAALSAVLIVLAMAIGGAAYFQREVDRRAAEIRRVIARVGEGRIQERIHESGRNDEFSRLDRDLNGMLDQIEQLMLGVRHVTDTIAHNLRTPLSRILLRLRDLQGRPAAEQAETLDFVQREVEDLTVVFDKLLALAEIEAGTRRKAFAPIDLGFVVREVVEFYEPLADEAGVAFSSRLEAAPPVHGDADLLASALANLLDNAIKFAAGRAGAAVQVRMATQDGQAVLSVVDNGPGISAPHKARIGEHFFRSDANRPGHGLGLASVLAIVRLHGGSLQFDDLAPGLQVRIVLPHRGAVHAGRAPARAA